MGFKRISFTLWLILKAEIKTTWRMSLVASNHLPHLVFWGWWWWRTGDAMKAVAGDSALPSSSKLLIKPSNRRVASQMCSHIWDVSVAENAKTNTFLFTCRNRPEGEFSKPPAQGGDWGHVYRWPPPRRCVPVNFHASRVKIWAANLLSRVYCKCSPQSRISASCLRFPVLKSQLCVEPQLESSTSNHHEYVFRTWM